MTRRARRVAIVLLLALTVAATPVAQEHVYLVSTGEAPAGGPIEPNAEVTGRITSRSWTSDRRGIVFTVPVATDQQVTIDLTSSDIPNCKHHQSRYLPTSPEVFEKSPDLHMSD